jgi:hypothetical protein
LLLLAPLALAQGLPAPPSVAVQLSAASARVGAGNETTVFANVTNGGTLAASVSLDMSVLEKWDVRAEPPAFALAAGQTQQVQVVLRAPAVGDGAASGQLLLKAVLTEDNTGRTAQGQAFLSVERVDPPVPAPPPTWTPERVALAAIGALVLVAAVAFALVRRRLARRAVAEAEAAAWRDRETGLAIEAEGSLILWGLRREVLQRVTVRNVSQRPRVANVGLRSATPGWTAAVSLPRLALEPGERATLTLYLNPSESIPGGEPAEFLLFARNAEAQEHEETLRVALPAPAVRIPRGDEATRVSPRR